MSPSEIIGLGTAAAAAGLLNAVAGGGTLLTFPALLFYGTGPIVANATSTLALVVGTAGSIFGFRRQIGAVRQWFGRFALVSAVGGWLGGVLLTRTSDRVFAQLVPFLLLFATVLFFAQGAFRHFAGFNADGSERVVHSSHFWIAVFFQFGVSIYGGYFGAGIGILMLASLGFLGLHDIHEMNALKNILASLINAVAAAWFVASGLIDWPKAGVMTVGALAGYFVGAHYSQRISQAAMRRVITGIGFAISAYLFYRQFL
jgi:uncharacterized protein